jgi:putative hydrolase of the HAD superfamily
MVWDQTPFAPFIDVAIFSSSVGLRNPDPRIYRLACAQLEIEPQATIFVGDGANDELAGAERVGMRAIMIHREGDQTAGQRFAGTRITRLSQLTALLD